MAIKDAQNVMCAKAEMLNHLESTHEYVFIHVEVGVFLALPVWSLLVCLVMPPQDLPQSLIATYVDGDDLLGVHAP